MKLINRKANTEGFNKLEQSVSRSGSLGFSFMTPKGENWFEGFSSTTLMYFKSTNPTQLSFFAGASEVPFKSKSKTEQDLLAYIKSYKNDFGPDSTRYKNVQLSLNLEKTSEIICVRYEQVAEDHKAKNIGKNKFLILTNIGRVCLQPTNKNMLVDIYYSSRKIPDLDIAKYNKEGEYFIYSLIYKD